MRTLNKNNLTIAVDGYSSCGKSTFAKEIARRLNYKYIDSGAMYRAVTLLCIKNNIISRDKFDIKALELLITETDIDFRFTETRNRHETFLNGKNVEDEIRTAGVSDYVSQVSEIGYVRGKMVNIQRRHGKEGGIVMDGRDIGTVVFPEADLKIFMTARAEVRAERRYKELQAKGVDADFESVKKNIEKRDYIDTNRNISPLKKAADAIVLDNSDMTVQEQMEWFEELLSELNYEN
ncbi:MAG: (d)CMP kinase [Bacteroidales bacterium]|nr:(d)CMP kinase [Bacteroidales bacterium]